MITLIILLLSALGFLNAFYLHWQYKQYINSGKEMFCLIGGKCADVISSKFGITFGIKNEVTGMVYYALLTLYLTTILIYPQFGTYTMFWVKMTALVATVFSIYLLFVQTIVLKTLCSWCLIAIGINVLIFYSLFKIPV